MALKVHMLELERVLLMTLEVKVDYSGWLRVVVSAV